MANGYVHPLAAVLVKDPANPPDLVFIVGFIGPVVDNTVTRIFLDPAMSRHVDVTTDQIVYTQTAVPSPDTPWDEDVIWVTRAVGRKLRPTGESLAANAQRQPRPATTSSGTPAGTVFTINVGGGGSGQPSPAGGDGGIGGGGDNNWNVQWPGKG